MDDPIRRALTRRTFQRGHFIAEEPDDTLVYIVKFGVGMTACLSALEIASIAFLHSWNNDVFGAITGLSCIVIGVFVGRKT
jgi:hypothetical protein